MSDAATQWISPFWITRLVGGSADMTSVVVLNPASDPTKVTVYWYDQAGSLKHHDVQTVGANSHWILYSPQLDSGNYGWLRIASEHPVVPWGAAPQPEFVDADANVAMSFYREDPPRSPIHSPL